MGRKAGQTEEQAKSRPNPADRLPVEKRFKPGQSGNPGGRPKGKTITAILRELLECPAKGKGGKSHAQVIAEKLISEASAGLLPSTLVVLERTEGKSTQAIEHNIKGSMSVVILPSNDRDPNPTGDPTAGGTSDEVPLEPG